MNDIEFCKKIIENGGICFASHAGVGPWGRTCSEKECPIYQEMPCGAEKAVTMAKSFIEKEATE